MKMLCEEGLDEVRFLLWEWVRWHEGYALALGSGTTPRAEAVGVGELGDKDPARSRRRGALPTAGDPPVRVRRGTGAGDLFQFAICETRGAVERVTKQMAHSPVAMAP
jgi:hypothetical protein